MLECLVLSMSNVLRELVDEIGGHGKFRWISEKDKQKMFINPEDYNDFMNLNQATRFASEYDVEPNTWRGSDDCEHDSIVEAAEAIKDEWDEVEIRFEGILGHPDAQYPETHLETMIVIFEGVEDKEEFKKWMELRFCSWLDLANYIDRDTTGVQVSHEDFRQPDSDPSLWAKTDEFDFREDKIEGEYCRIWWDD